MQGRHTITTPCAKVIDDDDDDFPIVDVPEGALSAVMPLGPIHTDPVP